MKWLVLLYLPIIFIFGCRKNKPDSANFEFQLGGIRYSFDSLSAQVDTTHGPWIVVIKASNTTTHSYVTINLQSSVRGLTGTYIHALSPPALPDRTLPTFSVNIFSDQNIHTYEDYGLPFTLTIDAESDYKMHGYFSGQLTQLVLLPASVTVSNGDFSISYIFKAF